MYSNHHVVHLKYIQFLFKKEKKKGATARLNPEWAVPFHRLENRGPRKASFPSWPMGPARSLLVDPCVMLLAVPGGLVVAAPTPYQLLTYKCPGKENIFILL